MDACLRRHDEMYLGYEDKNGGQQAAAFRERQREVRSHTKGCVMRRQAGLRQRHIGGVPLIECLPPAGQLPSFARQESSKERIKQAERSQSKNVFTLLSQKLHLPLSLSLSNVDSVFLFHLSLVVTTKVELRRRWGSGSMFGRFLFVGVFSSFCRTATCGYHYQRKGGVT